MKKLSNPWTFWVLSLSFLVAYPIAFADVTPVPDGTLESLLAFLTSVFDFAKGAGSLPVWGARGLVAGILMLLVNATKTETLGSLFDKLGPVPKRVLILALSALTAGVGAATAGATGLNILLAIFGSAAGAMLLHELLDAVMKALGLKA